MKLRKIFALIAVSVLVFFSLSTAAFADCGPKASTTVRIKGAGDREYIGTLLSDREGSGPWGNFFQKGGEPFSRYEDADGFHYIGFVENLKGDGKLVWGYYPPETFKVLLYFPDDGSYAVSGICERYAFDSSFDAAVEGDTITVERERSLAPTLTGFLLRLIITLAIETGLAFAFGFGEKKKLRVILITNIITQIALNLMLNLVMIISANVMGAGLGTLSALIFYIPLEIAVFLAEALIYAFNKAFAEKQAKAVWYALAANFASFVVGGAVVIFLSLIK